MQIIKENPCSCFFLHLKPGTSHHFLFIFEILLLSLPGLVRHFSFFWEKINFNISNSRAFAQECYFLCIWKTGGNRPEIDFWGHSVKGSLK